MRSVLTKPINPNSKDRCRQWDDTRLLCLPNVFLIGASKCGTSSWFNYLVQHPRVTSVRRRTNSKGVRDVSNEVHRFDSPWFHFYPMKVRIFTYYSHIHILVYSCVLMLQLSGFDRRRQ